jgi:hypothetical protein
LDDLNEATGGGHSVTKPQPSVTKPPETVTKPNGRKPAYRNAAERQKAYRERKNRAKSDESIERGAKKFAGALKRLADQ